MRPTDRSTVLYRKIGSIVQADHLGLDQLDESLEAALRINPDVTRDLKDLALDATTRIVRGDALEPRHEAVLEGIVLGNGLRPAFDIEQDTYAELPSVWNDLNGARAELTDIIRSVGRINVSGHPRIAYAGTAIVCGPNMLLTNRHVVEEYMKAATVATKLEFKPGMAAAVDLKQEVGSSDSVILEPIGDAVISTEWDAAIFKVRSFPTGLVPVPLALSAPHDLRERTAAVIGYPAFDESENLVEQLRIFRGVFNKKRLQPGKFISIRPVQSYGRNVEALAHDCTTLGGNSGGAVLDVQSRSVTGLHFGGDSGAANYCVPTWELPSAFREFRDEMSFV